MFYLRAILPRVIKELETPEAVVLTGPRQAGKTTILRYLYDQVKSSNKAFFDLENPLHRRLFEETNFDAIWTNLANFGLDKKDRGYLFLDEIQNLPSISQVAKYLLDHYQTKFFLTGSSSFYLKNLFPESLAGRKVIFELLPLTFAEFLVFKELNFSSPGTFAFKASRKNEVTYHLVRHYYNEYLQYGGFPKIVLEPNLERKKILLEDVFKSYFEKEVQGLADFGNLRQTRDLILLLSSRIAAKIEISKLASELSVSRETIYRQLAFLEQTYLIGLLPKFSRSFDRQAAGAKKLYFLDTGLARFLGHASEGQWLENSVWQNLHPAFSNLSYLDKNHTEIDFIVDSKIALEVKQSARLVEAKRLHQKSQGLGLKESYLVSLNWSDLPEAILTTDL